MKKYNLLVLLPICITFLNQSMNAQFELPSGLSLGNHLEYSYDTKENREILENWLNLDYRYGIFNAGLRFEVFQPNDPNPAISRGKDYFAGIPFKFLEANIGNISKGLKVTVGNFYELFGRGIVLKSYEDRNIRIDNNLLGVNIEGRYAGFRLKALTGMAANINDERKDILHAVDLEYGGLKNMKLGLSHAANNSQNSNTARTSLTSARVEASLWNFDSYVEYGIKQNVDVQKKVFDDDEFKIGNAIYGNLNFYLGSFSLSAEYKKYDNFNFQSSDGTIIYNTPPALRRDHTYTLLNRHPSPLDPNNEEGMQFEANYYFSDYTSLAVNYNFTNTLKPGSFYQRINQLNNDSQAALKDFYVHVQHAWSESFETIFAFDYNEELSTSTKNITPIIDSKYYFDGVNTLHAVLEHQQTNVTKTKEDYYADVFLLEYLRSPDFSISWSIEMQTKEPQPDHIVRKIWSFVQFGYKLWDHTDLRLLIGSRQAGNICIGGVCRYEPEFRGVELKLMTRLY